MTDHYAEQVRQQLAEARAELAQARAQLVEMTRCRDAAIRAARVSPSPDIQLTHHAHKAF